MVSRFASVRSDTKPGGSGGETLRPDSLSRSSPWAKVLPYALRYFMLRMSRPDKTGLAPQEGTFTPFSRRP